MSFVILMALLLAYPYDVVLHSPTPSIVRIADSANGDV
jgi:hypothetical protein